MTPSAWSLSNLDDVTLRGSGHTPSQKYPEYWDGDIGWVSLADSGRLDQGYISSSARRITSRGIENSSAVLHPPGTVIMSRDAGVGKSAILAAPMAVSQHFIAWNCEAKGVLEPWYLYYWLQSRKDYFERMAVGSTIKTIGLPLFRKLTISHPTLREQRAIAEILRTWDEAVAQNARLLALRRGFRDQLRDALFQRALEYEGHWTTFGEILSESRLPGTHGAVARKLTIKLYGKGVVPKSSTPGSSNTKYFARKAGQLVYSKLDFLNGAFAIVPSTLDGYETTLDLPAFDVSPSVNSVWLLEYLLRPGYYRSQVHLARGQRKARRISPEVFLAEPLWLPTRESQDELVEVLVAATSEMDLLERRDAALRSQKSGLMRKLLTGQVRVKGAADMETKGTRQ